MKVNRSAFNMKLSRISILLFCLTLGSDLGILIALRLVIYLLQRVMVSCVFPRNLEEVVLVCVPI